VDNKIDQIRELIGRDTLDEGVKNPRWAKNLWANSTITKDFEMKIIAIYHNKGGVGKTTTTVNLAATFSKVGKKVLVIDIDSQANATFATGLVNFGDEEKDNLKDNYIYHILRYSDFSSISEVARVSRFSSYEIDVIPSHIHLMKHENELNQLDYSRVILIQKLEEVKAQYDIVLIDTPPSLNLYARIALITTDYLLIPSDLKPFANQGLENVKEFINEVNGFRRLLNKSPIQILGVLPTKISTNSKFIQGTLQKRLALIPERYNLKLMDSIIFERDDLAKCTEQILLFGDTEVPMPQSIVDFKSSSKSNDEFQKLALEISKKIGLFL
jgi:cellulose biosynthesis protein BcsQ